MGGKLNSTGGPDYQVLGVDCGVNFLPYGDRNTHGDAKRTEKKFTKRGNGSNKITMVAVKNDTLIKAHGPASDVENRGPVDGGGFKKIMTGCATGVDASNRCCDPRS
jgi:hypothetical protein